MSDLPKVESEDGALLIVVSGNQVHRTEAFDCVLDRDDFGDFIGVEILSFFMQLHARMPLSPESGLQRWSYDGEMDAFYLHLREGRAAKQENAAGLASIDRGGVVASLRVGQSIR